MFLMISRHPRKKDRGKTNRLKAKRKAKNRRRVQGMRGKKLGKKIARKW
jgi:hypothetical protein